MYLNVANQKSFIKPDRNYKKYRYPMQKIG